MRLYEYYILLPGGCFGLVFFSLVSEMQHKACADLAAQEKRQGNWKVGRFSSQNILDLHVMYNTMFYRS